MSCQMAQFQRVQKVQLEDKHEVERKGCRVRLVIFLSEVVSCGPMLDEVPGLMDVILEHEGSSIQKVLLILMMWFGNYRRLA
jgi:hypothetical protein